jgi:hypothetical protein
MPKHSPGTEREIIMSVDRDAGVLDLRVFATQHKRAEVVGTATLRMADVPEVVRLLTEGLRGEELLIEAETTAKKSRNERRQNPDLTFPN